MVVALPVEFFLPGSEVEAWQERMRSLVTGHGFSRDANAVKNVGFAPASLFIKRIKFRGD